MVKLNEKNMTAKLSLCGHVEHHNNLDIFSVSLVLQRIQSFSRILSDPAWKCRGRRLFQKGAWSRPLWRPAMSFSSILVPSVRTRTRSTWSIFFSRPVVVT